MATTGSCIHGFDRSRETCSECDKTARIATLTHQLAESRARVAELERSAKTLATANYDYQQELKEELQAAHAATEQMREDAAKAAEAERVEDSTEEDVAYNMALRHASEAIRALPLPNGAKVLAERDAEIARLKVIETAFNKPVAKSEWNRMQEELTTVHAAIEVAKKALTFVKKYGR